MQAYIGIGSNQNAEVNIARATELMRQVFGPLQVSPLYMTPSVGFAGPDFLNGAIGLETRMSMAQVREQCQQIERRVGRRRELEQGCGSRCIDLDMLLFRQGGKDLQPPHPDVFKQAYSALPLSQLLPDWTHSLLGPRNYGGYVRDMGWVDSLSPWWPQSRDSASRAQAGLLV